MDSLYHMTDFSAHKQYLFLGKVSQTLTPAEEQELEELFSHDAHALAEYHDFTAELKQEDVADGFERFRKPDFMKGHLPPVIKKRRIIRKSKRIAAISGASLALIAIMIYGWQTMNRHKTESAVYAYVRKTANIELKLANGRTVNLSQQKGSIKIDNLEMQNNNGVLSYSGNQNESIRINSVHVPAGMDYKVVLNDGSEVWMNSETQLDFPSKFTTTREISIAGEAYLRVAKFPNRPFIVYLPHSTVLVTGTEFNVNTYDSGIIKVALVEGGVNMSGNGQTEKLKTGNEAVYNKSDQSFQQHIFDQKKTLSWRKGLYYFDSISFDEIAPVLKRWFGIDIKLDNSELNKKRFSGVLNRNDSIDGFLDDLKHISSVDSYFDKEGILHFK